MEIKLPFLSYLRDFEVLKNTRDWDQDKALLYPSNNKLQQKVVLRDIKITKESQNKNIRYCHVFTLFSCN